MRQILNIIVFLSILTLGLLAATGYTSESYSKRWDRSYKTSEVIGLWVMNHQGRYLGKVQDLVFDPNGHVIFAIIGYTRFNWRLIGENSGMRCRDVRNALQGRSCGTCPGKPIS